MICQWQADQLFAKAEIIDLRDTDKSQYFAITEFNNIVLSFDQCSFDQLNMSNHTLSAWGTYLPFSHKSVVSIMHEQNIICRLISRQLFAGHMVSSWPVKRKDKMHRIITILLALNKSMCTSFSIIILNVFLSSECHCTVKSVCE